MRGVQITGTKMQTVDGFFVAPAIGGEYLFSDRFSLGAEVQFRHTSIKGDEVSTLSGLRPGVRVPSAPEAERFDTSVSTTRVLFVTRFYF